MNSSSKHFSIGRSSTFLLYLVQGPFILFWRYISGNTPLITTAMWGAYWLVTTLLLLLLRKKSIYTVLMLLCAAVFTIALANVEASIYAVIIIFCVQWIGAIFFMDKKLCFIVLAAETAVLMYLLLSRDDLSEIWVTALFCYFLLLVAAYSCYRLVCILLDEVRQNELGFEERDRLLKELDERYQESSAALTAKTEFLANMSHEIRTPLGAIIGFNEVCIRECRQTDLNDYLQKIAVASRSLLGIINDILDFSKVEASCMQIVNATYSTSEMLDNAMQINMIRAVEKNLSLTVEVDPEVPALLCGDVLRNGQVLNNLLSNAIKYTKAGFVTVIVWTEPLENPNQVELYISVKDTGNGIRQGDIEKMFETFKRIDLDKNRSIEGTGLGLPLTKSLVQQMGGDISVESVYSLGSIFTVHFPQGVDDPSPIGKYEISQTAKPRPAGNGYHALFTAPQANILVVDDSNLNLMVVKSLLKETQVQTTLCTSGKECLEKMRQERYDLILLDDMMPNLTGTETLERARMMNGNQCVGVPIVALTANAISGAREQYLSAGFNAYLSKPIISLELEKLILSFLPERLIESKWNPDTGKMQLISAAASAIPHTEAVAPVAKDAAPVSIPQELAESSVLSDDGNLIDQTLGLKYCGGLPEMYSEILSVFTKEAPRQLTLMDVLFQAQDWKNYTISVHSLKSTALTIGAVGLSELAKAQEDSCKSGRTDLIIQSHSPLMESYRVVLSAVEKLLQEKQS